MMWQGDWSNNRIRVASARELVQTRNRERLMVKKLTAAEVTQIRAHVS